MDIFDKSKEVVGNHVGNATDEAMRVVVSKLLGAVNSVSAPSQSAQSGRMSGRTNQVLKMEILVFRCVFLLFVMIIILR